MSQKRVFGLIVLTAFVILAMTSFVSAQDFVTDFFTNIWEAWSSGTGISDNVARVLITVIVFLVVYSVIGLVPVLSREPWIQWTLSIIVAFLGTAFLQRAELYVILTGYGGLAVALSMILPFLILGVFTVEISKSDKLTPWQQIWFVRFAWGVFIIFVLTRLVPLITGQISDVGPFVGVILWTLLAVGLLIFLAAGPIIRRVRKGAAESERESMVESVKVAARGYTGLRYFAKEVERERKRKP